MGLNRAHIAKKYIVGMYIHRHANALPAVEVMPSVEMPKINPLYLNPVVGYLMWYLSAPRRRKLPQGGHDIHQYTEQEALARAMSHKPFTGITESEFKLALQWARNNLAASEAMKSLDSSYHDYTRKA